MNKKITAMAMLIIFMCVNFSCNSYYTKKIRLQEGKQRKMEHARVFTVYTKSRQLIVFLKKTPAVVSRSNIVGFTEDNTGQKKLVSIPLAEAEVLWVKKWDAGGTFINTFAPIGAYVCYALLKSLLLDVNY